MDFAALASCLTSPACIVTQGTGGLIIGMLLFLVAAGLTLIFGVLKVINFTHGSFYMLGAYFALTIFQLTGSYTLTILGAGAATALVGLIFERLFISRVYGQNVLMQLLVCYGFVLIFDDLVKIIWGSEFKSMGMPPAFQAPPLFIAGGVVPPFYLFVVGMAFIIGPALWLLIDRRGSARPSARRPQSEYGRRARHQYRLSLRPGVCAWRILGGIRWGARRAGALAHARYGISRSLSSRSSSLSSAAWARSSAPSSPRLRSASFVLRQPRLSAIHRRTDVSVHGDHSDCQADRPVRQGNSLTMRRRSLAFDLVIGAAALALLALLPLVFPSKALVDFMIRGSALALFATSLNFLVGYGGMVRTTRGPEAHPICPTPAWRASSGPWTAGTRAACCRMPGPPSSRTTTRCGLRRSRTSPGTPARSTTTRRGG